MFKKSLILFLGLFATIMSAQNFAYVKQDAILEALPNYGKNIKKIDSLKTNYQNDIKKTNEELNQRLLTLLKPYNVKESENLDIIKKRMSSSDTTSLSIMLDEEKIIKKRSQNYDLSLKALYEKEVQPLLSKINSVIKEYAVKNKIDAVYVFEQIKSALVYIDEKKDITKQIINNIK